MPNQKLMFAVLSAVQGASFHATYWEEALAAGLIKLGARENLADEKRRATLTEAGAAYLEALESVEVPTAAEDAPVVVGVLLINKARLPAFPEKLAEAAWDAGIKALRSTPGVGLVTVNRRPGEIIVTVHFESGGKIARVMPEAERLGALLAMLREAQQCAR